MILKVPPEPIEIREWMRSLRETTFKGSSANWDASVVWAGNKLPKYLWDNWKTDLKPLGVTWQKFMWILRQRTDVSILWYQGKLPWPDFIKKTIDVIDQLVEKPTNNSKRFILPPQDVGALQIPAFADWEPFERFCKDLWCELWDNPELKRHGRSGQAQAGVDVFGEIKKQQGKIGGVQCKKRDAFADDSLTPEELRQIVDDAKTFTPALHELVVAYTGKSDVKLQAEARKLTEENHAEGLFSVSVASWDDIKDLIGNYPDLLQKYRLVSIAVGTENIGDIKETGDAILKSQVEQAADTKKISRDVSSLRNDLTAIGELVKTTSSGGELEYEYKSELDEIKALIDSAHSKEALDRLTTLEGRLAPDVVPIIKFRVLTNKAAALASLGKEEEAALLFIEAFQYNPNDEKAICNKTLGYVLLGDLDEARKLIKEILDKNPLNERGHELSIYAVSPEESFDSIVVKVPEVLKSKEHVAYALAHAARDRDMPEEAIRWLEIAVNNVPSGRAAPDLKATLATAILQNYEKRHDIQEGIGMSSDDRTRLEQALSLLNEAIKTLEHTETLKYRTNWVGNRAVAHRLLGHKDKAVADAELALKLDPENAGFLRQRAFLLHEQELDEDAIKIFRQLLGKPNVPEVALLLAGIYHERGDNDSAIPLLEESISGTPKPPEMLSEEKRLLIHAYLNKEGEDCLNKARSIANELRTSNPGSVIDLVVASRVERRAGNIDESNQFLNEALTYISENSPQRDLFALADQLYAVERYVDAYPLYERLIDPKSGSPLVGRLIYSYYQAEQYEKAYEASRAVPLKDKTRFIYDVEVSILESVGNIKGAIAASEKFLESNPDDLAFKIRWATGLFRDNQLEKLDKFLKSPLDPSKLADDVRFASMRQLAWLYAERKMSLEALEIAYKLRKSFPRDGNAHAAYMAIFFDREKTLDEDLSPKIVDINTAIAVEEAGSEKRWYVIEKDPGNNPNGLTPDDPLAKKLNGKKAGDEIVIEEGKPSEARLKIVELKSKYVHALHESMSILPYLAGDNSALKRFTVKTDSEDGQEAGKQMMDVMDSQLAGQEEFILKVQKLYEDGRIPLGTFASLIQRDPVTVWGGIVNNPRISLRCCLGTQEERDEAIKAVLDKKAVVVDLIALLTLAHMDRLDLLTQSFEEIFVAQSTIDTLIEQIARKDGIGAEGYMTVWKEGGQYYRQEVSVDDIRKQIGFLQKIKEWVEKNCTKAPATEILKFSKERKKELYERIGASFIDTILIAKEKNCPIYSDDHGTRAIAATDFGVKGFWTQALAMALAQKEIITSDELEKINTMLSELRYRHTSVSSKTLLYAAKVSSWSGGGSFSVVLAGITGSGIEIGSAMGVAVEFFNLLWHELEPTDLQREALVFAVLDAVAQGRDKVEVLHHAVAFIQARFRLAPAAGKHVLRLISAWRSIRI